MKADHELAQEIRGFHAKGTWKHGISAEALAWLDRQCQPPAPTAERGQQPDEVGKVWWLHKYTGETRYGCPCADLKEQALWMLASHPAEPAPQPGAVSSEALFVIFDGPPSYESGRFIEVETVEGKSVGKETGTEWKKRSDGLWSLGPFYAHPPASPEPSEARTSPGTAGCMATGDGDGN